ncbi:MAG: hypothetical protein GX621_15985 [Pirellulaceae bacterium]|nr:hypothetical protein [Pirellulaceae bacterium]
MIGIWETDAELTKSLPQNQALDSGKLDSDTWLFGIRMKRRESFFPDGHFSMQLHNNSTDFTYDVIKRDGNQLTLRCQVRVDPEVRKFADADAFEPFESEWLIIGPDRIATKVKGESGSFWMVYRRIAEASNTRANETATSGWENAKREALASPPIEWSCTEAVSCRQKSDFHRWYSSTPYLVPEVYPTVNDWLDSTSAQIDKVITNKPTGAQYRITGKKQAGVVQCSIKFIGNVNWE